MSGFDLRAQTERVQGPLLSYQDSQSRPPTRVGTRLGPQLEEFPRLRFDTAVSWLRSQPRAANDLLAAPLSLGEMRLGAWHPCDLQISRL